MAQPRAAQVISGILSLLLVCVLSEMISLPEKAEIILNITRHFRLNTVFPLKIPGKGKLNKIEPVECDVSMVI
jgi:hypothetical protein